MKSIEDITMETSPKVFQLKIKLCGITPMIWRRIQMLSDDTFGDLHWVIQKAMGWDNDHMHDFTIKNIETGKKDRLVEKFEDRDDDEDEKDEDLIHLDQYFSLKNKKPATFMILVTAGNTKLP